MDAMVESGERGSADGGGGEPDHVSPRRLEDDAGGARRDAGGSRWPAAGVGVAPTRPRARHTRVRAGPDGAPLRARGAQRASRSTSTGGAPRRRSTCSVTAWASAFRACVSPGGGLPRSVRSLAAEQERVVAEIDGSGAKVVWVGTGQPKQELWMSEMRSRLQAPLLVGVGAAFDFHAGIVSQAPRWMQRDGLEWLYRLSREPRRLWRRYASQNPRFVVGFRASTCVSADNLCPCSCHPTRTAPPTSR